MCGLIMAEDSVELRICNGERGQPMIYQYMLMSKYKVWGA